jgi:hypothetical protein
VEAVHVLRGRDGGENDGLVNVRGQRGLDEDAVNAGVRVELCDEREQFGVAASGRTVVADLIPSRSLVFSFIPTYTREAGSSPTRTKARPACTPRALSAVMRCAVSAWICSAMARPSMRLVMGEQD